MVRGTINYTSFTNKLELWLISLYFFAQLKLKIFTHSVVAVVVVAAIFQKPALLPKFTTLNVIHVATSYSQDPTRNC